MPTHQNDQNQKKTDNRDTQKMDKGRDDKRQAGSTRDDEQDRNRKDAPRRNDDNG